MKIISDKKTLIKYIYTEKYLGFVPTMGAIHKGHLSLVKKSIAECEKTIVTIFINKPQFNKKNDFKKYPRILNKDISLLRKVKVDYLYIPKYSQIYPEGINKKIKINPLENKLCGKFRPGHFKAVVDVIDRFIKIINPKKIYLGSKDMQQLIIIKDFFIKNKIKTKVVPCKILRENSGIPYSSRNMLLKNSERKIASQIYKLILKSKNKLLKKIINKKDIINKIYSFGVRKIDYLTIYNINSLNKKNNKKKMYKIFVAYYLGNTRLIDNI